MASHGVNLDHECKHCRAKTQLYLCTRCTNALRSLLEDLPWVLQQLAISVRRQDRLTSGSAIGHSTGIPGPANLAAMTTADETRATLLGILGKLTAHPGLPGLRLDHIPTPDLARTLGHNVNRMAHHPQAGEFYADIAGLTEDDEIGRPGPLWKAINRSERIFAGPCPTVRGRDSQGKAIECGTSLYADSGEKIARCPRCEADVDVAKNRLRAATNRDLLPEPKLLEVLADLDEKVSRVKLYEWLRAKKLQPRGWLHQGRIVHFRIRRGDPAVYSLAEVRGLRRREAERQAVKK